MHRLSFSRLPLWLGLLILAGLLFTCGTPLRKRAILVIGDRHAALAEGWVTQLQALRKGGPLVNTARVGMHIGTTPRGQSDLNALERVVAHLRQGFAEMGSVDEVIIQLGTDECVNPSFTEDLTRPAQFRDLLAAIQSFFDQRGQPRPRIVLLSPPILTNEVANQLAETNCAKQIATDLEELAAREGYCFVDLRQQARLSEQALPTEGSYTPEGYRIMARLLLDECY